MRKQDPYKRQRNYRERQTDKGMTLLQRWVTPTEKLAIDAMLHSLRQALRQQAAQKEAA